MTRETREQRQQREAEEQAAAEAAMAEYYKTVPKRLLEAQALAQKLGVTVRLTLTETGPAVSFVYEDETEKIYIEDLITYQTEQWELESLEGSLQRLKRSQEDYWQRRQLAQAVFDRLSSPEKAAIKEHLHLLR